MKFDSVLDPGSTGNPADAATLTSREVCQVLREVIFGRNTMIRTADQPGAKIQAGNFAVEVDGWQISIHTDGQQLGYCTGGISPDGRHWSFAPGDRFGTDPVALLSTWEHQTLEQLLNDLAPAPSI